MVELRLKGIERITGIKRDADGVTSAVLYKRKKKKEKKTSMVLRPIEETVRRMTDAQRGFATSLSKQMRRSNCRRSNGWISDMGVNMVKAASCGGKEMRLDQMMFG